MKLKKSSKASAGLAVNGSSSSGGGGGGSSGGGGGISGGGVVGSINGISSIGGKNSSSGSNNSSNGGVGGGKDSSNNSNNSSNNSCGNNTNSSSNSSSGSSSSSRGKLKKKWKATKRKKGKENTNSSSSSSSNNNNSSSSSVNKDNNNSSNNSSSSSSVHNNNSSSRSSNNSSSSSVNNNNNNSNTKRFHVPTDPSECSSNWKILCQTVNVNAPNDPTTSTPTSPHTKKRKKSCLVPDSQSRVTGRQGGVLLQQPSKRSRTGEASNQKDHHHHNHDDDDDDDKEEEEKKEGPRMDEVEEAGIEPGTLTGSVESDTQLVQHSANDRLTTCVALDCEMVGTGPGGQSDMLARVSVVNQYGHCLYDTYVSPMDDVTDYRTRFSGVTPHLMANGKDFKTVVSEVGNMLKDRILVGHALHNDLKVLYLSHPKSLQRDTSKYGPFRRLHHNKTPSLRFLSQRLLGVTIQQAAHSSVIDAQAAMRLYMGHRKEWEARRRRKRKSKAVSKLRLKKRKEKKKVVG